MPDRPNTRSDQPPRSGRRSRLYTVLILCHERPRFRELHLSRGVVTTAASVLLLLIAGGLLAPELTLRTQRQADRLAQLEAENRRLWEERNSFEGTLGDMQEQLAMVEVQARRLAGELGLAELDAQKPAAGGPSDAGGGRYWFDGEFGALRSRTERLDASMEQLGGAFEQRARVLAATPSAKPVDGRFADGFGWRDDPWTGEREFHSGLDIVADTGEEVRAAGDGVVSRAERVGDYGKVVEITHGHGFVSRYAHLSEFGVTPGDEIRRGELIGRVGSTGRSTGPHLHFEVFRDGKRVNPGTYLAGR